jgi:hypothetical protein
MFTVNEQPWEGKVRIEPPPAGRNVMQLLHLEAKSSRLLHAVSRSDRCAYHPFTAEEVRRLVEAALMDIPRL